jgi:hypothetical protein
MTDAHFTLWKAAVESMEISFQELQTCRPNVRKTELAVYPPQPQRITRREQRQTNNYSKRTPQEDKNNLK